MQAPKVLNPSLHFYKQVFVFPSKLFLDPFDFFHSNSFSLFFFFLNPIPIILVDILKNWPACDKTDYKLHDPVA